jgi:4-amino-4-deoxy-L-arabinose transferase-like glycosyltransferase
MQQRPFSLGVSADDRVGLSIRQAMILIVVASTLVHFWAAARAGLAPDETYYWLWSRYPSFGYYDHPPMVAWLIAGGTALCGDTALGIRFFFISLLPITSLVVYLTGKVLFDDPTVASLATIWFNASILIGVGGIFATPDAPSVLFWSLAVLALALVWRRGRSVWWLGVGIAGGLGAISKYTNLFFGVGALAWIALDPQARRWLRDPWAWASALLAVLVFLPVILWNSEHDWVSFAKQFGRTVPHGVNLRFLPEFVLAQIGLINPVVAVFIGIGVVAGLRHRRHPDGQATAFLLALASPLVFYMLPHSFHDRVQGNWLAPIYPTVALVAAAAALGEGADASGLLRRLKVTAAPLGLTISLLGLLYLALPLAVFGTGDPSQLTRGWAQFANQVDEMRRITNADWIATTDYGLTGELAFHLKSESVVREIDEKERYTFEPPADFVALGQRALVVVPAGHKRPNAHKGCFDTIAPIGSLRRMAGHHSGEEYTLYLASTLTPAPIKGNCARPH